jgi:hypothetical protein
VNPVACLVIYGAVVFLFGGLLAPWLYWLAQSGRNLGPFNGDLAAHPFHHFVLRSVLGCAIVGLWPLLSALKMRTWHALGHIRPRRHWHNALVGFVLGFGSLICVALIAVAAGARHWVSQFSTGLVVHAVVGALPATIIVPFIEETIFRGAVFGGFRKKLSLAAAILASSAVYSAVHFFARPEPPAVIQWWSGLAILPQMIIASFHAHELVPGFFTLLVAGTVLALAYHKTGNLYFSIGLHAGWIFAVKLYRGITDIDPQSIQWFWGSGKMFDGVLGLMLMGVLLLIVAARFKSPPRLTKPEAVTNSSVDRTSTTPAAGPSPGKDLSSS